METLFYLSPLIPIFGSIVIISLWRLLNFNNLLGAGPLSFKFLKAATLSAVFTSLLLSVNLLGLMIFWATGDREVLGEKLQVSPSFEISGGIYLTLVIFFLSAFMVLFVILSATESVKTWGAEVLILVLTSLLGGGLLIFGGDFVIIFIAFEAQSLPLYLLLVATKQDRSAIEAAVKYFIFSIFFSACLLTGFAILYYVSGCLDIKDLGMFLFIAVEYSNYWDSQQFVFYKILIFVGATLIIIACAFKLALAPFHFLAPELYSGLPVPVMFYMSTVPKFPLLALLSKFAFSTFFVLSGSLAPVYLFLGVLSIGFGAFGALTYSKIARVIAFGGITHFGFIFIIFGTFSFEVFEEVLVFSGAINLYYYFYVLASSLFFATWQSIFVRSNSPIYIEDLNGLSKDSKLASVFFTVSVFSFAGLPPFIGFVAKLSPLFFLVSQGMAITFSFLLLFGVVGSIYYLRFVKAIFFDKTLPFQSGYRGLQMSRGLRWFCYGLCVSLAYGGFFMFY